MKKTESIKKTLRLKCLVQAYRHRQREMPELKRVLKWHRRISHQRIVLQTL